MGLKKFRTMKKKIFVPTLYPVDRDLKKVWFVKWIDDNGKWQKTYGILNKITTKRAREIEAKNIIDRINSNGTIDLNCKYDLVQLLSNLVQLKKPTLRRKSYLSFDCIVNDFGRWYRLERKRENLIEDYFTTLAAKGLHKNTIRNKHMVLKSLCKELIARKQIAKNPFEALKFKKVKATSKLPFSDNQIAELKAYFIKHQKSQLLLFCECMYYLFTRPNETRQLRVMDILFEEWKVCLSGNIAKDGDTIYKTIPVPFRDKIEQLKTLKQSNYVFSLPGSNGFKPLPYKTIQQWHRNVMKELNYNNRYSLYSWVHTGIKKAALSNIPIKELQIQKGHHDLNMFNQYLKDLGVDDCKQLQNNFPAM